MLICAVKGYNSFDHAYVFHTCNFLVISTCMLMPRLYTYGEQKLNKQWDDFFLNDVFFLIQSDLRIKENNILASFLDILCQKYSTRNVIFYKSILSYRALILSYRACMLFYRACILSNRSWILSCFSVYKLMYCACIVCFVYL